MRSVIIVSLLIISISTFELSSYFELVQKYTDNFYQEFYVSIGTNRELNEALFSQIRNWRSLFVLQEKSQIETLKFRPENVNVVLSNIQKDTEKLFIQNGLGKICQKHYLKAPQLLIINNKQDQTETLQSNFWNKRLCQPSIIFIARTPLIEGTANYLKLIGYIMIEDDGDIIIFSKSKSDVTKTSDLIAVKHFPLKQIQNIIQSTRTIHQATLVHYMSNNLLQIDDLEDTLSSEFKEVDIFVPNFRIATDKAVIWMNDYQVDLKIIQEKYIFYKILVKFQTYSLNLYITVDSSPPFPSLKVTNKDGESTLKITDGRIKDSTLSECKKMREDEILPIDKQNFSKIIPYEGSIETKANQSATKKSNNNYALIDPSENQKSEAGSMSDDTKYVIYVLLVICSTILYYIFSLKPASNQNLKNNIKYSAVCKQYLQVISEDCDQFQEIK